MSQTPEDPIYLTVKQAAKLLQVETSSLCRNLRQGKVPGVKICGQWRLSVKAIEALFHPATGAAPEPSRPVQTNGTDPAR